MWSDTDRVRKAEDGALPEDAPGHDVLHSRVTWRSTTVALQKMLIWAAWGFLGPSAYVYNMHHIPPLTDCTDRVLTLTLKSADIWMQAGKKMIKSKSPVWEGAAQLSLENAFRSGPFIRCCWTQRQWHYTIPIRFKVNSLDISLPLVQNGCRQHYVREPKDGVLPVITGDQHRHNKHLLYHS